MSRRLLVLVFALLLALGTIAPPGLADTADVQWITVPVSSSVNPDMEWDFPYSDSFFDAPATIYHHQLAQSSLGLAVAAYRIKKEDLANKDIAVRNFLTMAGFGELQSDEYDIVPRIDTIATIIGSKRIGETTLLAVAVSGGDYAKEWASNFSVGDSDGDYTTPYHEGFTSAAIQVITRVMQYINNHAITGPMKVWLTGYSRGAAVSNITAFSLVGGDVVADEDMYAYSFATPRNITELTERAYPSVFSIVGSFDPVPCVPFAEWGYERCGTTLYLPSQELCVDYEARKAPVDPLYQKLTGLPYWNNPQSNWICAKLMQTLDEVMQNAGVYLQDMQQLTVELIDTDGSMLSRLWQAYRLIDANDNLQEIISDAVFNTDTLYSTFAYSLWRQALGREPNLWNHGVSFMAELIHEHCPDVYIAWMFSQDDPADLYISELGYHQLAVTDKMAVSIVNAQGETLDDPVCFPLGESRMYILPAADAYTITLTATAETPPWFYVMERVSEHLHARVMLPEWEEGWDKAAPPAPGETLTIALPKGTGGKAIQVDFHF